MKCCTGLEATDGTGCAASHGVSDLARCAKSCDLTGSVWVWSYYCDSTPQRLGFFICCSVVCQVRRCLQSIRRLILRTSGGHKSSRVIPSCSQEQLAMMQALERNLLELQLLEALQTYEELEAVMKKKNNEVPEKLRQHPDNLDTLPWDQGCGEKAGEGIAPFHL